ncbi:MAG: DUF6516 family protein [Desulfobacterales bacterium]
MLSIVDNLEALKMKCDPKDAELQTLLDLDGRIFWPNPQYWVKFEAKSVKPTKHIPHGIKYSLTLHDRNNTRIIGFDNAHAVKKKGRPTKKYSGRIVTRDHVHRVEKIVPYKFESASQLLNDFWEEVDKIIL